MEVILVRHGITEYNRDRRYQGHVDIPLSEEGRSALRASDIAVDKVFVSPLMRAKETAAVLWAESDIEAVDGLIEMDFGVFDGRTADEMSDDEQYTEWVNGMCEGQCPGGEDKPTFETRTCDAFLRIAEMMQEQSRVAIVAHGGTQMALMSRFAESDRPYWMWQTKPGAGYRLNWDGEHLAVIEEFDFTEGGETCR